MVISEQTVPAKSHFCLYPQVSLGVWELNGGNLSPRWILKNVHSPAASELHFGTSHSWEEAMVWKGMETACRLALIYRWSPPAQSNKSQHYGPLNSEESSGPKEWEKKQERERERKRREGVLWKWHTSSPKACAVSSATGSLTLHEGNEFALELLTSLAEKVERDVTWAHSECVSASIITAKIGWIIYLRQLAGNTPAFMCAVLNSECAALCLGGRGNKSKSSLRRDSPLSRLGGFRRQTQVLQSAGGTKFFSQEVYLEGRENVTATSTFNHKTIKEERLQSLVMSAATPSNSGNRLRQLMLHVPTIFRCVLNIQKVSLVENCGLTWREDRRTFTTFIPKLAPTCKCLKHGQG